ncbi:hypothetical protein N8290_04115 [Pseudomonadales bacterium]|nr:hypothetical protein [Pseudomonadales bacterium]
MKIIRFITTTVATLVAASAFALPPAPVLPTGACAGIVKLSSLVTFPASEVEANAGTLLGMPMVSVYFDFDNSLAYAYGSVETAAIASGAERTSAELFKLLDGDVFTMSVSLVPNYAIEVESDVEGGDFKFLMIPTNAGTTFFVQDTDGLYSGVCQKV